MKQINFKKGFTLIEALVAISILMMAVAAPITIAQKGLSSAVYSKDQMIAAYLAQDAIEFIKNARDNESINNNYDWNSLIFLNTQDADCLVDSLDNDSGCQIDTIDENENYLSGSSIVNLKKDSNGFYSYDGTAETKFTRVVKVKQDPEESSDDNRALIRVTVDWDGSMQNGENQITVDALIFNY